MARKPLVPMEPRGSMARPGWDSRVVFVDVPNARELLVIRDTLQVKFPPEGFRGALIWLQPPVDASEQDVQQLVTNLTFAAAGAVRILPRATDDAVLPAEAGSAATESNVSEVRPVVAELIAELPESLRAPVTAYVEQLLASEGL